MENFSEAGNLLGTAGLVAAAMALGRLAWRSMMDRIEELRAERDYWRNKALGKGKQ